MRMYNPPHPGLLVKEFLDGADVSLTKAAKHLGISRYLLLRIIKCQTAISAEMALRLEEAFGATKAETWLKMQLDYDLWQAEQKHEKSIVQPFYHASVSAMV
ncbi:HigA family addiction module antitoxin [Pelistega europaea]|uniref:HigA family addiction module antidote protein n=1 Tax=Pelistega europaea TaxID=106147 RepID=A0A7Y4LB89_9BURK|nr:HigA family addiction module antitoxin [Pelistega europaea]NOL50334.1 HigA family addiction module antidote protein [Pelistega europaea]